ncbi:thermonuclease family protein [Natrialba sp. INN-245]|uniref:thermonuclease family protein n=1 Tax=Natrialba sp. INN-245 TaxID=2690967 RepID=UPI001313AB5E|nr:thermonuclease family protein [Natrialba sp. INN-245]MWV41554.1 nuclease [Natrialba sp. INN-245]
MGTHDTIGDNRLGRRSFVSLLGATAGAFALSGSTGATAGESTASDGLEALSFYSTASQVSADYGPLTDDDHVVAWASEEASVMIADEEGTDEDDVVFYDDERIPLISQDGNVMGIGSAGFLSDERGGFHHGNEQFVLNVWDELMGPNSTVLWDESHQQYWDLESHHVFRRYAEDHGYELQALEEFDADGTVLEFYSTASQIAADGDALTEDDLAGDDDRSVLAWAGTTATNVDGTDEGAYIYGDDERIPLITRDGNVVGFGAPFAEDESDRDENREFVLNVWDDVIDGETVYWDESHGQYYDASQFEGLVSGAEAAGYTVEPTDDLLAVLGGSSDDDETGDADDSSSDGDTDDSSDGDGVTDADAVVITTPAEAFSDAELTALAAFVDDGGAVFLHDQSDFGGHDETDNVNEIADALELGFRFNADQVEDDATGWAEFVFTTTDFAEEYLEGDVSVGLDEADGLVITTPEWEFWDSELEALEAFVDDGGSVFLFDQSDFGGNDQTENLNEIADHLDLAFRFNGGQVEDEVYNAGPEYEPLSTEFSPAFDYFADREGVAIEFERGEEYYGRVVRVFDGDTFEVEFDTEYGYRDVVRHIGLDTAETPPAENEPEEWFGIPDDADEHLYEWGANATEFSLELMAPEDAEAGDTDIEGRHVKMTFDENEPLRGNYGRLLTHMYYDPDEFAADFATDSFSRNYNRETIEEGYARVYSSGFSNHDEWSALEEDALAEGRGIWSAADFDALEAIRNDPVEELFVPSARSIRSADGWGGSPLSDDRVAVSASSSADQELEDGGVAYDDEVPLVGVDEDERVALVGGLMIHEEYEESEEFGVDTSGYGNFPFLSNLLDHLSETEGDVLVAGGQGQFNADGSLSLERCQYYLRYLEGVGLRLRQINDLPETLPAEAETPRAVLVTAPARELGFDEVLALREFRNDGGAIVMLGSAEASADHTENLNDLADALNTDLRFNADAVVDEEHNLADDPTVLETTAFDEAFPLFDAYDPSAHDEDEDEAPGNSGDAPGHQGDCPGNSGDAPAASDGCPGNSGKAPRGSGPGNGGGPPGHAGNGGGPPGHAGNGGGPPGHAGNGGGPPGHAGNGGGGPPGK